MMEVKSNNVAEKRFAQIFCVLFLCLGTAVFVFKRTDLFPWIGACNAAGYDKDYYLAYCHSTRYGDYEHYALYNTLESDAVAALKQAQVLFLGNSNTQYAFSTAAVSHYFESIGVKHYVMGFGQGAQSPVANAVMEKHQLQPQLVIANIDPFFTDETNGTFKRVLSGADTLDTEHNRKQRLQRWQARICSNPADRWYGLACRGDAETLYRNRQNGHWRTDYYRVNERHPVSESDELMEHLERAVAVANQFIDHRSLRRDCVLLTVTPKTKTPTRYALALSQRLQLPLIAPQLDGLVTIDHSHLDQQSALRWSTAFMGSIAPHVDRCIGTLSHAARDAD